MPENQKPKSAPTPSLAPIFHTILAAENKTSELFVKSFQYQGENVATKHLGQIFGFFEIPDTHEDNAYIVNFLASVVKKEYFVNPKRSATDAFEAALHKVNLALAELVRQGNTGWLGKLHGVVSVLENNTFHFSVTGDAAILLYRDNQVTLISEGLADKDAALHPLKTFLEISSGALNLQDKILITSPELFTLCEPETLRKNAFRMDTGGFARYVRAALVNELPIGVSMIIDLEKAASPAKKKKTPALTREASQEKLQNVFSSATFASEQAPRLDTPEESPIEAEEELLPPSEYTDQKTGHIYVQGEPPASTFQEPGGWQRFQQEYLTPTLVTLRLFLKRFTKKSRKLVTKKAAVLGTGSKELSQNLWNLSKSKSVALAIQSAQLLQEKLQALKKPSDNSTPDPVERSFADTERISILSNPSPLPDETLSPTFTITPPEDLHEPEPLTRRQKALARFSPNYQWPKETKNEKPSNTLALGEKVNATKERGQKLLALLATHWKIVVGILIAIFVLFLLSSFLTKEPEPKETPATSTAPSVTEETPQAIPALSEATTPATWAEGEALLVVNAEEKLAVVIPKGIVADGKVIPFAAEGTIESATYMPDLKIIFLWSSKNELVSWSIVDQKFTANIFSLPAGAQVSQMETYLTYLYVLDSNAGAIYRFARTEGGFSEASSWLKTPLTKGNAKAFIVNDTIRIADTTLDQYLRGTKEKTLGEESYQIMGTSNADAFTLAANTSTGLLTIWNNDGNQVYEGTHEELKGIQAITYNEGSKKLLVAKGQSLLEYTLSW